VVTGLICTTTCKVRISGRTGVGLTCFRALARGLRLQDPHIKVRRNKVLSTGSSSKKCSCISSESERITWRTAQLTHVHDTVCIVSFGKRVELKKLRDSRLSQRNFPEGVSSFNLLKPTGYVMHQQFNIQQLYAMPTMYLCVLYLSENKQRLVPLTA